MKPMLRTTKLKFQFETLIWSHFIKKRSLLFGIPLQVRYKSRVRDKQILILILVNYQNIFSKWEGLKFSSWCLNFMAGSWNDSFLKGDTDADRWFRCFMALKSSYWVQSKFFWQNLSIFSTFFTEQNFQSFHNFLYPCAFLNKPFRTLLQ